MTENVHALTGAYALDALDALERAAFEAHLPTCADCRAEVASLLEAAARLGAANAVAPPAALLDAVRAELDRTPQVTGTTAAHGTGPAVPVRTPTAHLPAAHRPAVHRRHRVLLGAAAAVLVIASGIGVRLATGGHDALSAEQAEAVRIMAAPDMVSHDLGLGSSHLVMSEEMGAAAVMGGDVPDPANGSVYQVWMLHADGSMAAGPTFMPHEGDVTSVVEGDLSAVTAFMVTEEPPGGSDHPTGGYIAELHL